MNYFYYVTILTMVHAVGDYALQSDYIAKGKQTDLYLLIIHVNIWTLTITSFAMFLGLVPSLETIIFCLWLPHLIMDYLKAQSAWFLKVVPDTRKQFIIDQSVHYLQLFVFVWLVTQ
ncbi:hypothetical protein EFP_182 [Enterococcus phage EF24C]|uniref:DUF3307 domain-containing protein n=2 Tax=Kochikohdavirus TaxID=2560160 RepID=A8E2N4_BPPHE|nr:membrane protein [Enterococcus phage EF24C]BAF81450.1 hypothetical protein EFP_182 [Enterococcus phage EF24C]